MKTTDSNLRGGGSGHTYTFKRNADGTTDLDAVVVREGTTAKGRLLATALRVGGKRVLGTALDNTVKAIEAGDNAAVKQHAFAQSGREVEQQQRCGDRGVVTPIERAGGAHAE
jgi:hypothetical protein